MTPERRSLILGTIVAVVALAVVVVGIVLFGSPMTRRQLRDDTRRVDNLRAIFSILGTREFEKAPSPLPLSLEDLPKRPDAWIQPSDIRDPTTKELYEYRRLSETDYELCAAFALPSTAEEEGRYGATIGTFWEHPAGRHCYALSTTMSEALSPSGSASQMIDERRAVEKLP